MKRIGNIYRTICSIENLQLADMKAGTQYCLKMDIRKFYPTIDHSILKLLLRKKFKDQNLLWLLDEIIDSADGLPIGNYLSQYFANFYLTYFDHWLKEVKGVKYYFRYADDIVILSGDKQSLHQLRSDITNYLKSNLNLEVKGNYQVFPVDARSIDFVGYRFYHTHTLIRKTIKQRFARSMARRRNPASLASYMGWAKHCNSKNLVKKLTHEKIQRPKHHRERRIVHRQEKRHRGHTRAGNSDSRLQSSPIEVCGQSIRQMSSSANLSRWQDARSVFGITEPGHEY